MIDSCFILVFGGLMPSIYAKNRYGKYVLMNIPKRDFSDKSYLLYYVFEFREMLYDVVAFHDMKYLVTLTTTRDYYALNNLFDRMKRLFLEFFDWKRIKSKNLAKGWDDEKCKEIVRKNIEKFIDEGVNIEKHRIVRKMALIEVARLHKIYYKHIERDPEKREKFIEKYKDEIELYEKFFWNNFNKVDEERLRRKIEKRIKENFENYEELKLKRIHYIRVVELQKNGKPHFHILTNIYFPLYLGLFFPKSSMIWDVRKINNMHEAINYVVKYVSKNIQNIKEIKKVLGVERFHPYRMSKGIWKKRKKYHVLRFIEEEINHPRYESDKPFDLNDERYFRRHINFDVVNIMDKYYKALEDSLSLQRYSRLYYLNSALFDLIKSKVGFKPKRLREISAMLTEEQRKLFDMLNNHNFIIVEGGAGTGKTTLIKEIIEVYGLNKKNALILAPTGKAADNLNIRCGIDFAQTISKALGMDYTEIRFFRNEWNMLQGIKWVIIDEFSMLSYKDLLAVLRAIPQDVKVVMFGDPHQLKPIKRKGDPDDKTSIMDFLNKHEFPTLVLSKVMRYNNGVAKVVKAFKEGRLKFEGLRSYDNLPKDAQILVPTRRMAMYFNKYMQEKLSNGKEFIEVPYGKGDGTGKLYIGDKIIVNKNIYELDVYNGMIGYVVDFFEDKIIANFGDRIITFEREHYKYISLAYALTIHKAQGSEYNKVAVILHSKVFRWEDYERLVYTAITRAKKRVGVWVV